MSSNDLYMTGNGYTNYRWILPYTASYENYQPLASSGNQGASWILFTGFGPSVAACKIVVSYVAEFAPNAAFLAVCPI